MKNLFIFLKHIIFSCTLLSSYWSYADSTYCDDDYYEEDLTVLDLMPGEKRCIKEIRHTNRGEEYKYYYLTNLQEFKIAKNGKYCLWGSKGWDEECQDAAMRYVYGEEWPKFKELIINFIKYIKNEEYDRAIALTRENACFFPEDNNLKPTKDLESIWKYNRIYINPACYKVWAEEMEKIGKNTVEVKGPEEFDITILKKILKDVDPNKIKFYFADTKKHLNHYMMIPYEDENTAKYFYIGFEYWFRSWDGRPTYDLQIYELGIFIPRAER